MGMDALHTPPSLQGSAFVVVVVGTGFELSVSHFPSRCFTAFQPPVPFAQAILEIRSHFLLKPSWTLILLFYTSLYSWDGRHAPPRPPFFVEMRSLQLFSADLPGTEIIFFSASP
jgi:hypothetical protein